MPTTANLALPYPSLSSAPNIPQDIQSLAETVDTKLGVRTSMTPVLTAATTNPTLGTGSVAAARYILWGAKMCTFWGHVQFGTTGAAAGSGQYYIALPVQAVSSTIALVPGSAMLRDSSAGTIMSATSYLGSLATTLSFLATTGIVSNAAPWTWAASDYMSWNITYETV